MGKKKPPMSLFSTIVQQINEHDNKISSNEYHLIDNEYFAAFNSPDDIQQFHNKFIDKDTDLPIENDNTNIDMKTFAQQFLIDLPEHVTKVTDNLSLSRTSSQDIFTTDHPINWSPKLKDNNNIIQSPDNKKRKLTTPVKLNNKRASVRNLSQSNEFIFLSDNDNQNSLNVSTNIFDCLHNEESSNQIVYDDKETSVTVELAEPTIIKNEFIESEQVIVKPKEEPVDVNMPSIGFGTSEFSGDLDNYVQNIHLLHKSATSTVSTRPQRIRKRKKFYNEEGELPTRSKKLKTPIRKKRPPPPSSSSSQLPSTLHLTDAEIEQQFGERLPIIKSECDDNTQQIVNSRVVIEFEPVNNLPQTPIEKARAKLTSALGRGHDPDTYLLKIRSREHKIIEVQLAIYGTADWHPQRTKILSKIEEALRGLRVSWTKIDILVDDFDVQISTSPQADSLTPPSSSLSSNANSSWFLKALSESGPLIVHIHDRRHPQQRFLIKCSCPECSPTSIDHSINSSLPVIVNVSPATTPSRRLNTPTILNKMAQTNISSLHNIDTTFFNELIFQYGRTIVISVTQCVLDLALIVSVHASLPSLCVSPNYSKEEYKKKYQQIIDPLEYTLNENEKILLNKTSMIAHVVSVNSMNNTQSIILSKSPDILTFHNSIKQNQANIRSAKSMRNLISTLCSTPLSSPSPPSQSNMITGRTLILPKPMTSLSLSNSQTTMSLLELRKSNERSHRSQRRSSQTNRYDKYTRIYSDITELKQQAHCTPIIELKPIMGGSTITTQNIHSFSRENNETIIVRDAQNNELKKVTTIISTHTNPNDTQSITNDIISPSNRVIRLSIAKSNNQQTSTSPPTIRLVTSPKTNCNNIESIPLVSKQINIIKPLSSSSSLITPAVKLSNPILISNKSQQLSTK
ncbi:unnamed protein product [Adineta steineri]|uniref:Uncharacterized protein n=1 Tax=Adineta steineri TaxID=433720 RepID=A0A819ALF2_9BILA|nr:unnamed protein product [Adineta steineri]CAF3783897.1 unnamed protein product [Adineta steineri]